MTQNSRTILRGLLFIGALAVSHACSAATLAVGQPQSALQDGTISVPIEFHSAAGEKVSGLQFEIVFDAAQLTWQGLAAGPAAAAASKMVSSNGLSKGRARVIIAGFNQTVIQDGTVATASFKSSESPPAVRLENAILSDPAGKSVPVVDARAAHAETNASVPTRRPACGCGGGIAGTPHDSLGDLGVVSFAVALLSIAACVREYRRRPDAQRRDRSQCQSR